MKSAESRLRDAWAAASERMPEPPDRLETVTRRGRRRRTATRAGALAVAAVALVAVPLALDNPRQQTVVMDPGPSPADSEQEQADQEREDQEGEQHEGNGGQDQEEATPEPTESPVEDPELIDPHGLGAPVLAWGPSDDDQLRMLDEGGERVVWPDPVAVAMPDRQGGVLLQPVDETAVVWLPDAEEERRVRLAEADGDLLLRGLLPGGQVLYSVRPEGEASEGDVETFFVVDLEEGAAPEQVTTVPALSEWTVGPAVAADEDLIHASCHLHCTLWPGIAEAAEADEPLYEGTAIEGLTATPDGGVIGFVESDITIPEGDDSELVLLDGASFEELARITLPLDDDQNFGQPVVSLSPDGQRVVVALGGVMSGAPPVEVPTTPYLVEDALTDDPRLRRIDAEGALIWTTPDGL